MGKIQKLGGVWWHIFFVSLFLIVPTLAFVRMPGEHFFSMSKVFIQNTTANFVLLCFFYLNYYVLLPQFYFNKRYILYIISILLFLSFAFTLPFLAGRYIPNSGFDVHITSLNQPPNISKSGRPPSISSFIFDEFRRHLSLFFTAVFLSFLLKTREHLAQLKEEKMQAELSSLRSQINPHFLFNTLNSIYALAVKKDDKTPDAITHLSGLMRYVIADSNDDKITLKNEIDYIKNYIALQKTRLGHTVTVQFLFSGEYESYKIAPLILITYIENAFKYGVNPDSDNCLIKINLNIIEERLELTVYNKKVTRSAHIESSGIGMKNTAHRLKYMYPEKHTLIVNDNEDHYYVSLVIELK